MRKKLLAAVFILLQLCAWASRPGSGISPDGTTGFQAGSINLNLKDTSVKKVFELLEQQINDKFMYMSDQEFLQRKISINVNNAQLPEVLDILKTKADLDFRITGNGILVKNAGGQETEDPDSKRKITGIVLDESNAPVAGASIFIEGTTIGTTSDPKGKFMLTVPAGTKTVSISFLGYKKQYINIENQSDIIVRLTENTSKLDEILVVGYGTESRKNVTASISSVDPKEIQSLPKANVIEMLEGRMPGVEVMSDNSPGGGTSIRVRGFSTINNNDPLVVIDGVPVSNGLNSINPSDIETIQVLKDAASASIYGSRAANGVIVITTKRGTKSESYHVTLDVYAGVQSAFNLPRMLNAQQYGDLLWEANKNDGKVPSDDIYGNNPDHATVPEWLNDGHTIPSADVDWVKEIMRNASVQSYNLSMEKSDEKAQHSFSLSYFNQEGLIKYTNFERYSARFNSSYKIGNFLSVGENFTGSYTRQVSAGTNSALGSIMFNAFQFPSIVPVKDINGNFGGNPINDISNPLGDLYRARDNRQKRIQALGNIYANLNVSDFTFKTSFGLNYQNYNYRGFSPVYDEILSQNTTNSLTTSNNFDYQWTWTNTLDYKKSFGVHNLNVLLGQEAIKYYYEGFSASRQNFLYEDGTFRYLSYGTENQLNSGDANGWSLNSYFGRANYNFDQKYLVSATVRRDGSSRLANNNWGTFPAFSVGWRIDRENFFKSGDAFSSLLLRASWGQTGNQQVSSYATVDSYSNNSTYSDYAIDGSQNSVYTGLTQTRVPNPNLKWETTTQTTVGADMGFLSNKLTVSAEYYNKVTDDILVYNAVPLTYGGTNDGQWINDGQMKNHGFEFDLGYKDHVNDFRYDVSLNLTGYKNKLTRLTSASYLGIPSSSLHSVNFDQEVSRSTVGQPIGSFFGYVAEGLFKSQDEVDAYGLQPNAQPGDIKFKDVNKDGKLDDGDRTFIGSPHPDLMLGLNIDLQYKRFDLQLFFNGNFGNKLYNLTKYKTHFFNQAAYNKSSDLLNAWSESNPDSKIPRLSLDDPNNNIRPSSYYVENGSYFKLNNLQLGYEFNPTTLGGLNLRLYTQISNVFTITNYSGVTPQIGLQSYTSSNRNLDIGVDRGIYPPARTFVVGCNLKF